MVKKLPVHLGKEDVNDTAPTAPAILQRMLSGADLTRNAQLAAWLGISPQAVSQALRKGRIPDAWIVRFAALTHLSVDWLLYGEDAALRCAAETETTEQNAQSEMEPAGSVHAPSSTERIVPPRTRPTGHAQERPVYDVPVPDRSSAGQRSELLPDIELVLVPQLAARLAAGQGSLETSEDILDYHAFRLDWLCRKGNPQSMVIMRVSGNSMEPEIQNGDLVLIDQGKTQIYGHAIYAVGVNEEIYIKQIETLPGNTMRLLSVNPRYEPIEVDLRGDLADFVHIIGRVIWWCREA